MKLTISKHATEQMKARGITEKGVRDIVNGSNTATIPSNKDPEAVIVLGKYQGNVWGIVYNFVTLNVITVRIASKKERGIYEQETGGK
jgi:uncharacterized DUF497 family protein